MATKLTTRLMICFLTVSLVCPSNMLASGMDKRPTDAGSLGNLPDYFNVQFKGTDRVFHLTRTRGGYDVQSSDGTFSAFLDDGELRRVTSYPTKQIASDTFYSTFTIEDATGAALPYESITHWNGSGDTLDLSVILPDRTPLEITVGTSISGKNMQEKVIIIVIGGAAILLCWLGSYVVDCGSECSSACSESGVESFDEGLCGTSCECFCSEPEQ